MGQIANFQCHLQAAWQAAPLYNPLDAGHYIYTEANVPWSSDFWRLYSEFTA